LMFFRFHLLGIPPLFGWVSSKRRSRQGTFVGAPRFARSVDVRAAECKDASEVTSAEIAPVAARC